MDRTFAKTCAFVLALGAAAPVAAMDAISDRSDFMNTIDGRDLRIGMFGLSLVVTDDGRIEGKALGRPITGQWSWQDGFFCRDIMWGEREIPYNCQLVEAADDRIRFTTDRGAGNSASFNLR